MVHIFFLPYEVAQEKEDVEQALEELKKTRRRLEEFKKITTAQILSDKLQDPHKEVHLVDILAWSSTDHLEADPPTTFWIERPRSVPLAWAGTTLVYPWIRSE